MALQGSLAEVALPDVLQLVSVSGKTGVFTLTEEGVEGKIFLKDGLITDAAAGLLRGEDAVYEMASWRRGSFIFTANVESERVTVTRSNTAIMMEAARRLDEWRVLERKIPSLDLVPYFLPRESANEPATLSPAEWAVVAKVDGQLSIRKLAVVTGLPAFSVCKLLYGLVTSGVVGLHPAQERQTTAAAPGPSQRTLLAQAESVRKVAEEIVGLSGALAVEKQYRLACADIESGKGQAGVRELVERLARIILLLEGAEKSDGFRGRVTPLLER